MEDTFQNVVHVVPGGVADRLAELGAQQFVEYPDTLSHGPSEEDPKGHRQLRLEYWRGLYGNLLGGDASVDDPLEELREGYLSTEQVGSVMAHHAEERRVVVWSTPTFEDRLFLWFTFEAAREADLSVDRLATAEPRVPVSPDEEDHFALRDLEVGELAEGFDALVYPKEIYVRTGADLWQTFSSASPRKFAISVPHTEKFFPNIETIAEQYGWMFPVVRGEDSERLFPSRFDRNLLRAVPNEGWSTPFEVLGEPFVDDFHFVDDVAIAARLADWAETGGEAGYLERREESPGGGPFDRFAFRRLEPADRICEEGFDGTDEPPVLKLGDCRIYAGAEPWAKVVDDEFWWFERFEESDGAE